MSSITAQWLRTSSRGSIVRYTIAIISVLLGLFIVCTLQHFSVRDPIMLIYLAAVAVSFWYGGRGPGALSFAISTANLLLTFFHSEHNIVRLMVYDLPIIVLYFAFVWWIQFFTKSHHRLEEVLRLHGEELEMAVRERTSELSRVNAEYKTILYTAPFGIVLFGPNRTVERCNPEYERMIGCDPGEIIGQQAPLPEDQREPWQEHELRLQRGLQVVDYEAVRSRRDGSQFPASIWLTPVTDRSSTERRAIGFILDNTERKIQQAERQMLTMLVQRSPALIAVTDETGRLTFVNSAGRRLLGLGPDEDIATLNLSDHFRIAGWKDLGIQGDSALAGDTHFEVETVSKNSSTGAEVHLCCTSFIISPAMPGGVTLRAFVAQDISGRKDAEARLRQAFEENRNLLDENRALQEKLQRENIFLHERNLALETEIAEIQQAKFEKIIGDSPAIRRTLARIELVAMTDATVLITGETGTGKELIAQSIHENSKRARMPFRAINCAALPTSLMAAELFGHEKGAFTGAERLRLGQFELANGGTLFLDEIAEMPVETQAMLLRVLEERGFERLGGTKLIAADVRIIAATNRDLQTAMERGEFRQDLYFRLNGFRIEMPPLRERKEDIPLLVQHFVQVSAERHGKQIRTIEKSAMEMLLGYRWPGNVRELRNVIDTSVIISPGEGLVIDEELLLGDPVAGHGSGTFEAKVAQYERNLIERALTDARGRVSGHSGAASLLGLPASTLSAKVKIHRIDVGKFKHPG